ncbi:MAG: DnaJ C-terminal domain-containing protein [Deinococcales bacterium]
MFQWATLADVFEMFNKFNNFSSFVGDPFRQRQATGGFGTGFEGEDIQAEVEISLEQSREGQKLNTPIEKLITCDRCQGSRAEPGKAGKEKCPTCHGIGQVRRQTQSFLGTMITTQACPQCQGAGLIVPNPCTQCRGQGRIKGETMVEINLPKGIDGGHRLRIPQQGNVGLDGGPAGSLYVDFKLKAHEHFERHEENLYYHLDVGIAQAVLGSAFEIPTLDGEPEVLSIPAGTQPMSEFRLRGRGMPRLQRMGTGDIVVVVNVVIPKELSPKAREALESYAEEVKEHIHEKETLMEKIKGFFKAKA